MDTIKHKYYKKYKKYKTKYINLKNIQLGGTQLKLPDVKSRDTFAYILNIYCKN